MTASKALSIFVFYTPCALRRQGARLPYGSLSFCRAPRIRTNIYIDGLNLYYRDKDQVEVDIVIERGALQVAGVEVKAAATVTSADFRGLRKLRGAAGDRFAAGVVIYDDEITAGFGDGLFAVPIRRLLEGRPVGSGNFRLDLDRLGI